MDIGSPQRYVDATIVLAAQADLLLNKTKLAHSVPTLGSGVYQCLDLPTSWMMGAHRSSSVETQSVHEGKDLCRVSRLHG